MLPARDEPATFRPGVRLGVDVGTVRIGVAVSDREGLLAAPVETVARDRSPRSGARDLARLRELVDEREVVEVLVGLPRSLSGREGPAAAAVREFAARLAARLRPVPVRLVDERLTTVAAHRDLRGGGVRGRRARVVVDQSAAALILQSALDVERSTGKPPGESVLGQEFTQTAAPEAGSRHPGANQTSQELPGASSAPPTEQHGGPRHEPRDICVQEARES